MEDTVAKMKKELRKYYREIRSLIEVNEKNQTDKAIEENIIELPEFLSSATVFTYVSTEDEVNTRGIIDYALKLGKKVAVPRTIPEKNIMEFYQISSLDDLKPGKYGILEPEAVSKNKILVTDNSVCLVPGLSFDHRGNRLGYGGGYYDRFLSDYSGVSIGLCRKKQYIDEILPCDKYDRQVDVLVNEDIVIDFRLKQRI